MTKEPIPIDLLEALRPLLENISVNDGDTLSSLMSDQTVVWQATGSWQTAQPLTLGHLRNIARIVGEQSLARLEAERENDRVYRGGLTRDEFAKKYRP